LDPARTARSKRASKDVAAGLRVVRALRSVALSWAALSWAALSWAALSWAALLWAALSWAALVGVLTLVPQRAAAELPPELEGRPIAGVEVLGEARGLLDADELHLSLGTPLTRTSLRRAVLALLGSGEWADVLVECEETAGGVLVHVTLVPRVLLTRIELQGNASLSDQAVLDVLGVHEDGEIVPDQLGAMRAALKDELALRGFVGAEVELSLRDTDSPSRKVLRVVVHEGEPLRVSELRFVAIGGGVDSSALVPPEDAELSSAIGVGEGDVLDRTRLEDGLRHAETQLRERGYLEARVEPALLDLARGVIAVPVRIGHRYRVEIRGHAPLERTNVEEVLQLSDERLTRPVAEDVRLRIVDLYQRHGFLRPTVVLRRTLDPEHLRPEDGEPDPRFAVLLVETAPGERTRVVGVSFPGATHFAPELLRDQIRSYLDEDLPSSQPFEPVDDEVVDRLVTGRTTARRGVRAHILDVPASVWMESTYAEAVGHITELYQAAGFLDASVGPAELRELEDGVAVVTVPVYEGPRTLVYDVRVAGNELLSTHEILEAAHIQRGEPFGYITLEEARRRVLALYQDRGHFFARVAPVVHRSGDRERAEIVIEVVEGYPVHVGAIRVEGIEGASEELVRQALHFGPGELYRPDVVRQSEDALLRLGVFSSVSITPVDPDLPERVKDVVVTVAERLPQELALSAGIGTGEGARGSFEYTYRNLFGYAVSLSLRAQLAFQFFFQDLELQRAIEGLNLLDRLERRITIGLAVPHIPGLRDVRAGLDLVHLRDNFRDFGLDKNGAVLTLTYQPERRFTGSLSTEVEQNTVGLFDSSQTLEDFLAMTTDPRLQRLLRVPAGVSALASVRGSFAVDLRDSAFTPTDGFYASAALEWAHTLVTERAQDYSHFFKLTLTANGYVRLAEGWVLALQARGGRVFHLEPTARVYPNRAYFMGGVDSLRGFLQDQVIPQDQVEAIDAARRAGTPLPASAITRTGELFYLGRVELRFPIAGDLQGGAFVDLGNVWAFADAMSIEDFANVRVSAGLGLRLSTPVGPIAADYGVNLTRRDDQDIQEPFGAFHFSIGLF
jgi:outer membrane protein assembly complex protein YaeT